MEIRGEISSLHYWALFLEKLASIPNQSTKQIWGHSLADQPKAVNEALLGILQKRLVKKAPTTLIPVVYGGEKLMKITFALSADYFLEKQNSN